MSNPTPKQTTVTDPAELIVAFFEAWSNRFSELRDDPVLAPILSRALERYQVAKRGSDFTAAARLAATQAVREILEAYRCPE